MLQVPVEGCRNGRARQTDSQTQSGGQRGYVGSEQLINVIVEIGVEDVFIDDPEGEETDDAGFDQHQDLDRAGSNWFYWTPGRTQSAIGLYAYEDEALAEDLRRLYPC